MRVLLIDHHDSFTWNLAQAVGSLVGRAPQVLPHDDDALLTLPWDRFDAVILSPGPGHPARPADARHTAEALRPGRPPVLGVCLGMQLLAHHTGARVGRAPRPVHGRSSPVHHDGDAIFAGIPSPTDWVRYHSLACTDLPTDLIPLAWADDGVLMALRHGRRPWWGVQFHPESVASAHGSTLLANFLALARAVGGGAGARAGVAPPAPEAPAPRAPPPGARAPSSDREGAPSPGEPVLHEVLAGVPDPEALHATRFARTVPSVWLDGAATRDGTRFSILGDATGPRAWWLTARADGAVVRHSADGREETVPGPLLAQVREALGPPAPSVPGVPFALGLVGWLGYELRAALGSPVAHPSPHPDAGLVFLDRAVVLDHVEGRTHLLALDHPDNRAWMAELRALVAELSPAAPGTTPSATPPEFDGTPDAAPPRAAPPPAVTWRNDRAAYRARVLAAQAYLADGESYELCLTNQARVRFSGDPVATYRRLRRENPAPFAALVRFPGLDLLSSSPERFVRVARGGHVVAEPIKGTRRRAADPVADAAVAAELASAEKDRSENLMIVDLLRNDLGRVCTLGSVHVPRLFAVERYATVHQLVSTIAGRLRPGTDVLDLLAASFPPGSMTGAPKLRSMALLEALEGGPRGPYSGVLGWFSRCGAAELSVVIRSAVIADGDATVGVGGAIVALSDPDAEVAEMELKAEAVLRALGSG